MKRVAIPLSGERLSEYFGECDQYEIFEINDDQIKREKVEIPLINDITELPDWAAKQNITDVVTNKINKLIISLFTKEKINLFVGIKLHSPHDIIESYLKGTLKSDYATISEITKK